MNFVEYSVPHLEDAVVREFEDTCKSERLTIKWKASPDVKRPGDYVESWRILLWDKAFPTFIGSKADPPFDKKSNFSKFPWTTQAVKRVVYM